jgi:hypothetical protein
MVGQWYRSLTSRSGQVRHQKWIGVQIWESCRVLNIRRSDPALAAGLRQSDSRMRDVSGL